MPKSVFEILGIAPTDNFTTVKKAYLKMALKFHPDRYQGEDNPFVEIATAYEKVNEQHKLEQYFRSYQLPQVPLSEVTPMSTEFTPRPAEVASDALRVPKHGYVSVFILVPIFEVGRVSQDAPVIKLPRQSKDRDINFNDVADILTKQSSLYIQQVGISYEEAVLIINQHSIRHYSVAVEVLVPLNRLSDAKASEAHVIGALNSKDTPYFWLLKGTKFSRDDILSIRPILEYGTCYNSIRFIYSATPIEELWPVGHPIIYNQRLSIPVTSIERQPATLSSTLRSIFFSSPPSAAPVLAIPDDTEIEDPFHFTPAEIQEINKLIDTLTAESTSWLGQFQMSTKQNKIDGLYDLLRMAQLQITKAEAINSVEKHYPNLRDGIHSRTAELLDRLKSSTVIELTI